MYNKILAKISVSYNEILGENLVGIYVHGSIAFGCFHWDQSDIDFLVVVNKTLTQSQKTALIQVLLGLSSISPPKGLEMSVVREKHCFEFTYPTPFELHFSNFHIQRCRDDLEEYCKTMNGTDADLAAHFMVTKEVGIVLSGKEITDVFGDVPKEAYLDSIKSDIEYARNAMEQNPVYLILNLCRVLAFIEENAVISKHQGGLWGLSNLPGRFLPLIQAAHDSYCNVLDSHIDMEAANEFYQYMTSRIFAR